MLEGPSRVLEGDDLTRNRKNAGIVIVCLVALLALIAVARQDVQVERSHTASQQRAIEQRRMEAEKRRQEVRDLLAEGREMLGRRRPELQ